MVRTAGGTWPIADAADWQCLRWECSSAPGIEVLCSADTDERWCRVCTALVVEHQANAAWYAADGQTAIVLATRNGVQTLRTQDTSDPRHFGPTEVRTHDTSA